ncbi:hypothetical protein DSCW_07550 [Desulfosarcina widdelii]|uniref:Potassium transporter n=2 Tax=Desulfosarcina widdelii TaxID=947919 RepID=A0A5K7YXK2_9BACT|nr:hypothetical protein DSCW_07550 [Desulfosarcina widdelii]
MVLVILTPFLSNAMTKDKRQKDPLKGLERFWIIGAGRFGQIAVERIGKKKGDAEITVVDKKSTDLGHGKVTAIRQDGIQWLAAELKPEAPVDIVVPAIPIHVAYEWLKFNLSKKYKIIPIDIPDEWLTRMPHAMRGAMGQAYVSHADFICPDNCPEPENICTHTGKPRPMDLFRLLAGLDFDDVLPIVIRSHQLLPGVGGIYPGDFFHVLETIRTNRNRSLMIATACRCHGVVDFFRLE